MKILKGTSQFALLCILMLSAYAFAQEPVQDLQDSLAADSLRVDSLSKISLTAGIDTNDVVDTNKVESVDVGFERRNSRSKDFFPDGFVFEVGYPAVTALHLSLWGIRMDPWDDGRALKKYNFLFGVPIVSFDVDENMVSDEGILALILFFVSLERSESTMKTLFKLDYLLFGNTYFSLSNNGQFGLFEKHRILDYGIYSLMTDGKPWEFGFSEAFGLRLVLSKNYKGSGYYIDLGGHVRITNQRFRYGLFVQLGAFGSSK